MKSTRKRWSRSTMSARGLLAKVRRFRRRQPVTDRVNKVGRDQRDHWIGWLREQGGPGYYGRKKWPREAKEIYNRVQCPEMVLWLAEAAGAPRDCIEEAAAAIRAHRNAQDARTCAAVRRILPWNWVRSLL